LIYLDTSVLAAYYCPEPLSDEAESIVRSSRSPAICDLTEVELLSALSRKVRTRKLDATEAERIATKFLTHLEDNLYKRFALERRHYLLARDWLGRFNLPLRTLDALHLAVATSEELRLVTADRAFARSAEALGIDMVLVGGNTAKSSSVASRPSKAASRTPFGR